MRLAVLSDIQGNLAALEAVLDDIDRAEPEIDRIFGMGDLVGRGPRPNEVLELCTTRGVDTVLGNYDDAVAFDRLSSGADFPTRRAEQDDLRAIVWTKQALTGANMEALRRVPRDLRLYTGGFGGTIKRNTGDAGTAEGQRTFLSRLFLGSLMSERPPPGPKRTKEILLIHGTPRALNEFVLEDTAISIVSRLVADARADVVIMGHSGVTFKRKVGAATLIGSGSLSGAHMRPGQADYAIVDVGRELDVEFRTVEYDARLHLEEIETNGLPMHMTPLWPV